MRVTNEFLERISNLTLLVLNDLKLNSYSHEHPLIFPVYSDGNKVRISEQEFSTIFIHKMLLDVEFQSNSFLYSIETPTERKYLFSKDKIIDIGVMSVEVGSSASSDLSIYDKGKKKLINIEFKHNHHRAPIFKDILKLIAEPVDGALIIYLSVADRNTINNVVNKKLKPAFSEFICFWEGSPEKQIHIIICSHLLQPIRTVTIARGDDYSCVLNQILS